MNADETQRCLDRIEAHYLMCGRQTTETLMAEYGRVLAPLDFGRTARVLDGMIMARRPLFASEIVSEVQAQDVDEQPTWSGKALCPRDALRKIGEGAASVRPLTTDQKRAFKALIARVYDDDGPADHTTMLGGYACIASPALVLARYGGDPFADEL